MANAPTALNGAIPDAGADGVVSAVPSNPPAVAASSSTFAAPTNGGNGSSPAFPTLSAATAELLARARANASQADGPAFEKAREAIMKGMMTSDKLPIPAPNSSSKRGRGRGGRVKSSGDGRSPSGSTPGSNATPVSDRGRGKLGRGRGRGRGRGGSRGGKRKRTESVDSEAWSHSSSGSDADLEAQEGEDSDVSASYTPLPKVTKSGRSINKPSQYVPVIAEPASQSTKKKRPYRRNIEATVCKMCHRPTSPTNNQIVFCDGCGTPYHQYCHDPPIENDVVEVQEKEWFCTECVKSRENTSKASIDGLMSGESLTMDEKRARLSALPQARLVDLVLRASSIQPSLALFPTHPAPVGENTSAGTISTIQPIMQTTTNDLPPLPSATDTIDLVVDAEVENEHYDGYDTDPPAHYPKAGNGLARTLRPETDDLEWLVDENDDVFSHQVKEPFSNGDVSMDDT